MAAKQKFNFSAIKEIKEEPADHKIQSLTQKLEDQKPEVRKDTFEVRLIPRQKIRVNKKNQYILTDITKLKDSILNYGLQQNLSAVYSLEEDMYILEAGHRRTAALDMLIETYSNYIGDPEDDNYQLYLKNVSEYEKGYPVKVSSRLTEDTAYDMEADNLETIPDSILESEIRLHITNQEIREESPAERARHIRRLGHLYDERNRRLGRKERINVNKNIGSDFGITDRQVKDIRATEHLIPELQEEFERNNITLKNAAAYARLDPEDQKTILELIHNGNKVSSAEVSVLKQERDKIQEEKKNLSNILKEKDAEIKRIKAELRVSDVSKAGEEPGNPQLECQLKAMEAEVRQLREQASSNPSLSTGEASLLAYEAAIKVTLNDTVKKLNELSDICLKYQDSRKELKSERADQLSTLDKDELVGKLDVLNRNITEIKYLIERSGKCIK